MVEGWVLEFFIKFIGCVVIVLVKRGIFCLGDFIVVGRVFIKICLLRNEVGVEILEVFFGIVVEILGWRELFVVGD